MYMYQCHVVSSVNIMCWVLENNSPPPLPTRKGFFSKIFLPFWKQGKCFVFPIPSIGRYTVEISKITHYVWGGGGGEFLYLPLKWAAKWRSICWLLYWPVKCLVYRHLWYVTGKGGQLKGQMVAAILYNTVGKHFVHPQISPLHSCINKNY